MLQAGPGLGVGAGVVVVVLPVDAAVVGAVVLVSVELGVDELLVAVELLVLVELLVVLTGAVVVVFDVTWPASTLCSA
jgi:hypothetical protein